MWEVDYLKLFIGIELRPIDKLFPHMMHIV